MSEKKLMQIARFLSLVFSPLFAPIWILTCLFFSYLRLLPLSYKLFIITLVLVFTIIIPSLGINIFRSLMRWTHLKLSFRRNLHMPYIITICSYTLCLYIMSSINVTMSIRGIVMAAFVAQILCTIINFWWKISIHMIGMGGLLGALISFSLIFYTNPIWPACGLILLSGAVGTSRIILRQHTLMQVFAGFILGLSCSMIFIQLSWI